jgi:hypothetical protein
MNDLNDFPLRQGHLILLHSRVRLYGDIGFTWSMEETQGTVRGPSAWDGALYLCSPLGAPSSVPCPAPFHFPVQVPPAPTPAKGPGLLPSMST